MKSITSDEQSFYIYKDEMKMSDGLPAGIYRPVFVQYQGWHLEKDDSFQIKEKMYSNIGKRIQHVFQGCMRAEKNIGCILSGEKGLGKSMAATSLCLKFVEAGLPVILIDRYVGGLVRFLDSINEPCVVAFDEYEKNYENNDRINSSDGNPERCQDTQYDHLSLFNGLESSVKRIFIITCNDLRDISRYFLNRTGRFHYHIRFSYPSTDDIKEYLLENVDKKYHSEIDEVIAFSNRAKLTFDSLRSIVFELNDGIPFRDFINDLNILPIENRYFEIKFTFTDDKVVTKNASLSGDDTEFEASIRYSNNDYIGGMFIPIKDIRFENGKMKAVNPLTDYIDYNCANNKKIKVKDIEITEIQNLYTYF